MVSIVATSDLHQHFNFLLPRADLAIIAGDWSYRGIAPERYAWEQWLLRQKKEHPQMEIVWINGNHEVDCQHHAQYCPEIAKATETHYLEDSGIELYGLKIWGSPYQPEFCGWAYQYERPTDRWERIPEDLDILITHGPPLNILDGTRRYHMHSKFEHVGCYDLAREVEEKRPKIHIFGHIHDAHGYHWTEHTEYYNVARCNEDYDDIQPIAQIEL